MASIRDQIRTVFRQDGKDHVNVSHFGKTAIGQYSALDCRKRFFIPHLGEFDSPRCFANWLVSGGNDSLRFSHARYNTPDVPLSKFQMYMMYAKYFQLVSVRNTCITGEQMLELPWVSYKQHLTGVKEHDRWEAYADNVKIMAQHVVSNGIKTPFDWSKINHRIELVVQERIREIAEASGADLDAIVDLTKAEEVAAQRKNQRQESQNKERKGSVKAPATQLAEEFQDKPADTDPSVQTAVSDDAAESNDLCQGQEPLLTLA